MATWHEAVARWSTPAGYVELTIGSSAAFARDLFGQRAVALFDRGWHVLVCVNHQDYRYRCTWFSPALGREQVYTETAEEFGVLYWSLMFGGKK